MFSASNQLKHRTKTQKTIMFLLTFAAILERFSRGQVCLFIFCHASCMSCMSCMSSMSHFSELQPAASLISAAEKRFQAVNVMTFSGTLSAAADCCSSSLKRDREDLLHFSLWRRNSGKSKINVKMSRWRAIMWP